MKLIQHKKNIDVISVEKYSIYEDVEKAYGCKLWEGYDFASNGFVILQQVNSIKMAVEDIIEG